MHLCSTYNEAKELFKPGLKHFQNALKYYILNGFVTEHVIINQEISSLYKYIVLFEKDLSTKCKLHKRRVNILKPIEAELSLKVYENLILELCFELGNIYEEMASIKRTILDKSNNNISQNDTKKITKINDLFNNGITYFSKFIKILEFPLNRDPNITEPALIPTEYITSYIQCKFMIAAIYNKMIPNNSDEHIKYISNAIKGYKFIVKYCDINNIVKQFQDQYNISKQLSELLPLKINQIQHNNTQ